MKVAELTGVQLDYWVARAEGYEVDATFPKLNSNLYVFIDGELTDFEPSSNLAQGGAIIEREKITCVWLGSHWTTGFEFEALSNYPWWHMAWTRDGETRLISAMRSYLFKKFGEEVPDIAL